MIDDESHKMYLLLREIIEKGELSDIDLINRVQQAIDEYELPYKYDD